MEVDQALSELYSTFPLYQDLFDKQLKFILDPSKRIAALCSSRAGKTRACVIDIIQTLSNTPNAMGLYLGLTDTSIRSIFMPIAQEVISKYSLKVESYRNELRFKNGSILLLFGANDPQRIENFRGLKLSFVIIDECASFRPEILGYLYKEILSMRVIDTNGRIILIGTPAAHCSGLFYEITQGQRPEWSIHKWTGFDNPYISEQFKEASIKYLQENKCTNQDPKFRREFLGEWAADEDELMIKPYKAVIGIHHIKEEWRTVIGVDIGFNDQTAFSVIGWRHGNPQAYVLETLGKSGLTVSDIAQILLILKDKYQPIKIAIDPAAGGKTLISEFGSHYGIHAEPAKKNEKKLYIEIFNSALVKHELVLCAEYTIRLQEEMHKVVWNEDRSREYEGCVCDHLDATLYAFREALAFLEEIPKPPKPLTLKDKEKKMEELVMRDYFEMKDKEDPLYIDIGEIIEDPYMEDYINVR